MTMSIESPTVAVHPLPAALATEPRYDDAFEAWSADQYQQAQTALERAEALAQMSLPQAWETVAGQRGEAATNYLDAQAAEATEDTVWQHILYADLLDSPLGHMHMRLRAVCQDEPTINPYLPDVETMPPATDSIDLGGGAPVTRPVPEGFVVLQRAYDMSKRELEADGTNPDDHDILDLAGDYLLQATLWRAQPGEHLDALAWAQLGDQAREGLLRVRRTEPHIPIKPERFVGQADDIPSFATYKYLLTDFIQQPETVRVERARQELRESHERARTNPRMGEEERAKRLATLERILASNTRVDGWIHTAFQKQREVFFDEATVAHQALYLCEWLRGRPVVQDAGEFKNRLPWLGNVSDGLTTATFRDMRGIDLSAEVYEGDAEKMSAVRYIFGEDTPPDKELEEACSYFHDPKKLETIRQIKAIAEQQNASYTPREVVNLANAVAGHVPALHNLLGAGYTVDDILQNPWLGTSLPAGPVKELYPVAASYGAKQRWLCDHAPAYLHGGWNRATVGNIIQARLKAYGNASLDDVSAFLEAFQVPETTGDTRMYDTALETTYLANMLALPPDQRQRLQYSGKRQHIEQLFFQPEHGFVYQAILELTADGAICSPAELRQYLTDHQEEYYEKLSDRRNPLTTARLFPAEFSRRLQQALDAVQTQYEQPQADEQAATASLMHATAKTLKAWGANRQEYIRDTSSWLLKHATSSDWDLLESGSIRYLALAAGAEDTPRAILEWYQPRQVELIFGDTYAEEGQLSAAEISQRYSNWVDEALRVYAARDAYDAIQACAVPEKAPALFPAVTTKLTAEDGTTAYGSILSKDDPRGLTAGFDTHCCQQWTRRGPQRCIEAGYNQPNAGFYIAQDEAGRMSGQSFFYVHPEHPEILVLDSIEAHAGRNPQQTLELYEKFWRQELTERAQQDPNWKVRTVQIGTRYNRVKLDHLPEATVSPVLSSIGYTDAAHQRILFTLTDEELAQPLHAVHEAAPQPRTTGPYLTTVEGKQTIVADLETSIFPPELQYYKDADMVSNLLYKPAADIFSFVAQNSAGSVDQPIGYCLAYAEKAQDNPDKLELHIDSFAVTPGHQNPATALYMFKELLDRATDMDIQRIVFDARESSSYRLATSESLQRRLKDWGFVLINDGLAESAGKERLHGVSIVPAGVEIVE